MLTKERFEHELLKIKSQVGPERTGSRFLGEKGKPGCIMGQMMENCGALKVRPATLSYHSSISEYIDTERWPWGNVWAPNNKAADESYEPEVHRLAELATKLNDAGVPWHDIIDALVPQAAEVPVALAPEPEVVCV